MSRTANIVSFDDARNASRRTRASRSGAAKGSSRQQSQRAHGTTRFSAEDSAPLRMPSSRGSSARRSSAQNLFDDFDYDYEFQDEFETQAEERPRSAKSAEGKRSGSKRAESKRDQRKRERNRDRAEKMFAKQFVGEQASDLQEEGAPRAALYEGKMGSSHRKAARMQNAASALPQTAKINPAGWLSNLNVSPAALRIGTAVICLVLVGLFLYTPAKQYYQAQREHDRLEAEYEVVMQRNEALNVQNDMLSSSAGMEDAVRRRYGYVIPGDQPMVVTGLSDQATDARAASENVEANVLSSAVKAPEEWYTPYLDYFFGVQQ